MRDSMVPAFNYIPLLHPLAPPMPPSSCDAAKPLEEQKKEEEKEKRGSEALDSASDGENETHLRHRTAQAISMVN